MRNLYVTLSSNEEIGKAWRFPTHFPKPVYVRCTKDGIVNWESTLVYNAEELIKKNNVKIISR